MEQAMKYIDLTQDKRAICDDEDFEYLSKFKWCVSKSGQSDMWYAITTINKKQFTMQRIIFNSTALFDHHDMNGLNNSRRNLRECSFSQNMMNRPKNKGVYDSEYKGVGYFKPTNKWRARLRHNYKLETVYCNTEIEAALAYNQLSEIHHGEFGYKNIIK
jgi:hypothetical protein